MPIERVVTILTPVFGAVSAWLTGFITTNFPGLPTIPAGDVTALQIAGFTGAAAAAIHWLHGRQKFVQFTSDADKFADSVVAKVKANQVAAPALSDIESVLRAHTDAVVEAIGKAVHAPPSVEQVVQAMADRLAGNPVPPVAAVPPAPVPPAA